MKKMSLNTLALVAIIGASSLTMTSCKKKGCMDSEATNYNADAKKDDGSCVYDTITEPEPVPVAWDVAGWFSDAAKGNSNLAKWQDAGIDPTIFDLGTPTVLPQAGSMLLSGADFTGLSSYFNTVNFKGAFGTTDWTQGWVDWNSALTTYSGPVVEVPEGNITGNVTWTSNNIYRLNGFVRVQDGAVLTIEAGTVIYGDTETKGTLIIQRGGKMIAEGTASNPIIMTSEKAPGLRQPGDWGGLVVCGKAPNNVPGGNVELEGGYGAFHGGNDANDNSGIIKYVQVNFAGIPINPNEEVNSLTMGSVGAGTVIENVLCAYGLDDAFEWFGGTVNCKYLVAYRGLDDDLDVDLGFSGNVQFALCIRGASLADQSGSNGFEVDNDGSGSNNAPFTAATFSNVTIIGPKKDRNTAISLQFQNGAQLRRNCKLKIHNSFITGYPNGIFIDGSGAKANADNNELVVKNTVIAGVEHWGGNGYGSAGTVFTGAPSNGAQHPNNPRGIALKTN